MLPVPALPPATCLGSLRGPALRQAEDLLRLVQQGGAAGHLVACMQEAGVDARGAGVQPALVRCEAFLAQKSPMFLVCSDQSRWMNHPALLGLEAIKMFASGSISHPQTCLLAPNIAFRTICKITKRLETILAPILQNGLNLAMLDPNTANLSKSSNESGRLPTLMHVCMCPQHQQRFTCGSQSQHSANSTKLNMWQSITALIKCGISL